MITSAPYRWAEVTQLTKLTSIVTIVAGEVQSVRAHAGFKSDDVARNYLECLELAEVGLCVEMWPIELYSDVGDVPADQQVRRFRLTDVGWTTY